MFLKTASVTVDSVLDKQSFHRRQADKKIVEYDPSYVFVVVRAVSADRPNNNGDCFPHEELTRIDAQNKRPVWASFIGKGVYVNHQKTDDPTQAKGIILDARYVDSNPEDRYVELLLGIDKQKDPIFAQDIARGTINKFSMGASVQRTICSVCNNEARREEEFCEHIAKHKMREVEAAGGKRALAYEKCFGVTYNEVSAVSDPADETAETLHRVASHSPDVTLNQVETVSLLREAASTLRRLEEAVMGKVAITKRADEPAEDDKEPKDEAPAGDESKGDETPDEDAQQAAELATDILDVVVDLIEKKVPPAEAVEQLTGLTEGLAAPASEGEVPMASVDVVPPVVGASRKEIIKAIRARMAARKQAKAAKTAAETKPAEGVKPADAAAAIAATVADTDTGTAATGTGTTATAATKQAKEGGEKGQYPDYKVQKDPKQTHSKPLKGRPSGDFAKDKKEYAKLMGITASFLPNPDKRRAAWVVESEGKALFMITGASAWGNDIEANFKDFSSEEYASLLIKTCAEKGIDTAMDLAGGIPVPESIVKETAAPASVDTQGILAAAERKAEALAQEKVATFKTRFIAGLKVATELQDKNVLDNVIRAAAFEVLAEAGVDPELAEMLATAPVVEAHLDEAIRKAMEYVEMTPESFEEVKAHVTAMPTVKVAGSTPADPESRAEDDRLAMRRRASLNGFGINATPGNSLGTGSEDGSSPMRRAIRGGGSMTARHAAVLAQ